MRLRNHMYLRNIPILVLTAPDPAQDEASTATEPDAVTSDRSLTRWQCWFGDEAAAAGVDDRCRDGDFERLRWVAYTALVTGQVVRGYPNRSLLSRFTACVPTGCWSQPA